jgi:IS30 family transposase
VVTSKLLLDWSPKQISGWLKTEYPKDEGMRVSHETIYRSLFIQARGVLKKELMEHLRTKRRMRRSQHSRIFKDTAVVVTALSRHIRKFPATLRRSLTWDRGLEMARHQDFTVATDVQVYFWRSAKSLAARHERKHQPPFKAILPARNRPVCLLSGTARSGRTALESTRRALNTNQAEAVLLSWGWNGSS